MKRKTGMVWLLKPLLVLFLMFLIQGCAFPEETTVDTSTQRRYNKIIEDTYGPLIGTYEGTLRVPESTREGSPQVQLIIFMGTESMKNADGTPGSKKVPLAFLRLRSNWIEDHNFSVQGYDPDMGSFSLQNVQVPGPGRAASADDMDSASLRFDGDSEELSGDLRSRSGIVGLLGLKRINREVVIPRRTIDDQFESRRKYLESVAGNYEGFIQSQEGAKPISIELSLAQESVGGATNYYLTGYYRRLDVPGGEIDLLLEVVMHLRETPARLIMNGRGRGIYQISIQVKVEGEFLQGALSTIKGPRGPVSLKRKLP